MARGRQPINVSEVAEMLGVQQSNCPNCKVNRRGDTLCDCGAWDDRIAAYLEKIKTATHPYWRNRDA